VPQSLQERVRAYVRRHELLRAGDRIGVAVSGGADSVALLHLLLELRPALGLVLSVVHFNHQIRGAAADADEHFVKDLAERFALEFCSRSGNAPARAREKHLSLESAARELRYAYFRDLCLSRTVDKVATAHTLDDQAETVLLRLLRGAWTRGLAGIHPAAKLEDGDGCVCGAVVRPLLQLYRSELRDYLGARGQDWREDASNRDLRHARNRVRHQLLPLLCDFSPEILERLSEMAEIARTEEAYWQDLVGGALAGVVHCGANRSETPLATDSKSGGRERSQSNSEIHLCVDELAKLPAALQQRLVRQVTPVPLDFRHTQQVLGMIAAPSGSAVELPRPWRWRRVARCPASATLSPSTGSGAELILERSDITTGDYDYPLPIPGEVAIPEIGGTLRASRVWLSEVPGPEYNRGDVLNALALESCAEPGQRLELRVRNWRPGDRFWPVHTRSPKKVKELLQTRHLSGRERAMWAVVVNSVGELVWLRGFGVSQAFVAGAQAREGILIELAGAGPRVAGEGSPDKGSTISRADAAEEMV
jgi:tRNA(Ile)-lysidine synthase